MNEKQIESILREWGQEHGYELTELLFKHRKRELMKKPNPGSKEAIAKGCTCAVSDNHGGKGFPTGDGDVAFWISGDCPLHAVAE